MQILTSSVRCPLHLLTHDLVNFSFVLCSGLGEVRENMHIEAPSYTVRPRCPQPLSCARYLHPVPRFLQWRSRRTSILSCLEYPREHFKCQLCQGTARAQRSRSTLRKKWMSSSRSWRSPATYGVAVRLANALVYCGGCTIRGRVRFRLFKPFGEEEYHFMCSSFTPPCCGPKLPGREECDCRIASGESLVLRRLFQQHSKHI